MSYNGPATPKQLSFLENLLDRKDTSGIEDCIAAEDIYFLTCQEASRWIDTLMAAPFAQQGPSRDAEFLAAIPAGRYAVDGEDGTTDFYKVDHGAGKWQGRIFVSLLTGSPGGFHDQRLGYAARCAVLEKIIAAGPEQAARRFGLELGVCAMCGSPLTNPDSRAAGIGPECRRKF